MRMQGIVYKKVVIGWCGFPHWSKGRARAVFWQCWPRHNANRGSRGNPRRAAMGIRLGTQPVLRSEEHTSELQSLMRNSYAVFCLKQKKKTHKLKTRMS